MSKFSGLRTAKSLDFQTSTLLDIQKSDNLDITIPAEHKAMGRPRSREAKHRHPAYRQVTAYLRRDTYAEVRSRLFTNEREFSDLVQDLLVEWLKG